MGIGNFVQGAVGGGLAGSTLGPLGTIGGGLLGGLAGMFGSDPQAAAEAERKRYLEQINQRQAPLMGPAAQSDYSGFRQNQQNLISQLEAMARGEGPSVSKEMLNQALNKNVADQNAIAASGRGGNMAAMLAANNTGRLGAQSAQDAALGRVQEQIGAINNLGMQIYSGRGADEANNQFNAQQRNYRDQQNAQNQLSFWHNQDAANLGFRPQNIGPSMADQILAGGGALSAFYNTQRANNTPGGGGGWYPGKIPGSGY